MSSADQDFREEVRNSLNLDLVESLVTINVGALQGLLLSLMRKVSDQESRINQLESDIANQLLDRLAEHDARIEKLDFELEHRASKPDVFVVSKKVNTLVEELHALTQTVEDKVPKEKFEGQIEQILAIEDRLDEMQKTVNEKATADDIDRVDKDITDLSEIIGQTQDALDKFIGEAKPYLEAIGLKAGSNGPIGPAGPLPVEVTIMKNNIADLRGETDKRLKDYFIQTETLQDALAKVNLEEISKRHGADSDAYMKAQREAARKKRDADELFIADKVDRMLTDHRGIRALTQQIEDARVGLQQVYEDMDAIRFGTKREPRPANNTTAAASGTSASGSGASGSTAAASTRLTVRPDTPLDIQLNGEGDLLLYQLKDAVQRILQSLVQKANAWNLSETDRKVNSLDTELRYMRDGIPRTLTTGGNSTDNASGMQYSGSFTGASGVRRPAPRAAPMTKEEKQQEEMRLALMVNLQSQCASTESMARAHAADIDNLFKMVQELSADVSAKMDNRQADDLKNLTVKLTDELKRSNNKVFEQLDTLRAELEKKADKMDNLHKSTDIVDVQVKQDLKNELVLREIFEDISRNLHILSDCKADAQAVSAALVEKADLKLLATKANKSYCESLVADLKKTLNEVAAKVDSFTNSHRNDLSRIITGLKGRIKHKADRKEVHAIATQILAQINPQLMQSFNLPGQPDVEFGSTTTGIGNLHASGTLHSSMARSTGPPPSITATPAAVSAYIAPAHPPQKSQPSYNVDYYRRARKSMTHQHNPAAKMAQAFQRAVQIYDEEPAAPATLPPIPAGKQPPHPPYPIAFEETAATSPSPSRTLDRTPTGVPQQSVARSGSVPADLRTLQQNLQHLQSPPNGATRSSGGVDGYESSDDDDDLQLTTPATNLTGHLLSSAGGKRPESRDRRVTFTPTQDPNQRDASL
eukprot:TRINITY_DN10811_c0_g1_i2.p1 TRINITY_DN10811_c0_g1~~TRINITY_DN10811_c0_g1_i2.p1  ORF type:complete len:931 (+),score=331.76 TRINITY_DN10811_c0_g1_i2:200-2992(+)